MVNFINLSRFLFRYIPDLFDHKFFEPLELYKVIILLLVIVMVVCFTHPEQLKIPAMFSFIMIISIIVCLWIRAGMTGLENSDNLDPFIGGNWFMLIGNVFYSIEGISSIFTIRSSMEVPSKMKSVSHFLMIFKFKLKFINL